MNKYVFVRSAGRIIGRLPCGCDLLQELTRICIAENIVLGRVEAIGAVSRARVGFYDQSARSYRFLSFDRPHEIAGLIGNISIKDGVPFIHAHITLAAEDGTCFGGHLAPETEVFACEFVLEKFDGAECVRCFDEQTGLPLWHF